MRDFSYRFTQKQSGLCNLLRYSHHTYEQNEAVENFEPHAHPHTELIYVLNGNGTFTQNNMAIPIARGDLLIVNAYTPHSETVTADCPLDVLFFAVDAAAFKKFHTATLGEMLQTAAEKKPLRKTDLLHISRLTGAYNGYRTSIRKRNRNQTAALRSVLPSTVSVFAHFHYAAYDTATERKLGRVVQERAHSHGGCAILKRLARRRAFARRVIRTVFYQ